MKFSIMLWGDYETSAQTYDLLIDVAKFADKHNFAAIWIPERHFHSFGGHYPNPAVLGAAVSAVTNAVHIRAGSVVVPLHNPIRIAEEWSAVDVLSNGRVEISIASGWQPNDFVLCSEPEGYAKRKQMMWDNANHVRRLWRGEQIQAQNGLGEEISVGTYPRPVNPEIPMWVTSSGNVSTFEDAGTHGYSVLTHLLGQTFDEVKEKIRKYRASSPENGGRVALMLHTYVGQSEDEVLNKTKNAFRHYLWKAADLSVPAEMRSTLKSAPPDLVQEMLDIAFERYYHTGSLLGTVEHCEQIVEHVASIGVDEVCCLVDFGIAEKDITEGLFALGELSRRCSG